jgi:hypothetical protein
MREMNMPTGNAHLITRAGRRIALSYQLSTSSGNVRTGNLLCDTSVIDPGVFCERMTLVCDDGISFDIVATHVGDRHISFVGNVLAVA